MWVHFTRRGLFLSYGLNYMFKELQHRLTHTLIRSLRSITELLFL